MWILPFLQQLLSPLRHSIIGISSSHKVREDALRWRNLVGCCKLQYP